MCFIYFVWLLGELYHLSITNGWILSKREFRKHSSREVNVWIVEVLLTLYNWNFRWTRPVSDCLRNQANAWVCESASGFCGAHFSVLDKGKISRGRTLSPLIDSLQLNTLYYAFTARDIESRVFSAWLQFRSL